MRPNPNPKPKPKPNPKPKLRARHGQARSTSARSLAPAGTPQPWASIPALQRLSTTHASSTCVHWTAARSRLSTGCEATRQAYQHSCYPCVLCVRLCVGSRRMANFNPNPNQDRGGWPTRLRPRALDYVVHLIVPGWSHVALAAPLAALPGLAHAARPRPLRRHQYATEGSNPRLADRVPG